MSVAHLLYQLQAIDLEIDSAQTQLQHLQEQLGETAALQAARSALQQAQQALAQEQARLRSLDMDVKTKNEHIKAQEAKLYGGKITNPRELDGLAKDVQMLKHNRDKLEDDLLAVMLAVDEQQARLNACQTDWVRTEAAWREAQAALQAQIAALSAQLGGLQGQRTAQVSGIDPASLTTYDRLRQLKGGRVVVWLEGSICQGCRLALPSGEAQHARMSPELTLCSNCGRILYAGR
jgi:predicted  nucleic acid-binding Zn-ribbon protein